jgi:hypothetical protein
MESVNKKDSDFISEPLNTIDIIAENNEETTSGIHEELVHSMRLLSWINNSDDKTHAVASLSALFTIVSAVTARAYYTKTRASTTLFQIVVAKTGVGKNNVVTIPDKIMSLIGQEEKIITGKINSEGALDDIFKEQKIAIQVIDEFGDQLGHMLNDKGGYLKVVASKYKTLYSLTNGIYKPSKYSSAGGKNKTDDPWQRERPCFGITGLTTESQLLSVLDDSKIHDGFLNRFIIMNGNNVKPTFNDNPQYDVPADILAHIRSIKMCPNFDVDYEGNYIHEDEPIVVPLSKEADRYYYTFIGDADIEGTDIYNYCKDDTDELKRAISVRWRENTIRLATALTAYEKQDEVSVDVLEWCYNLVKNSSIQFLKTFNEKGAKTKYLELKDKAIYWFKNNIDKNWIPLSYLARSAHVFKNLKSKERNELLDDLCEIGVIQRKRDKDRTNYYKIAS